MKYFILILIFSFGCSGAMKKGKDKPNDTLELRGIVLQFHQQMRWGLWEKASWFWTESTRQAFLGRYEELGDDFKITDLEIRDVKLGPEKSIVEVEQKWYHEPDMTLHKDRFMETWVMTENGWRLAERMKKKAYRAREKRNAQQKIEIQNPPKNPKDETQPKETPQSMAPSL